MKSEPLSPTLDGYVEQAGDQADFDDNLVRVRVTPKQRDVSSYTQNQIYLMEFNRLFGARRLLQASSGPKGPRDQHGYQKPAGLSAGLPGVGVRVWCLYPTQNPYPSTGW